MTRERRKRRPLILVADDDESIRRFVGYLLRLAEFDVIACADGEQAVEAAVARRPALLLLDIGMPRLDGFDAYKAIVEALGDEAPPAIFLTALGGAQNRRDGLRLGAVDFVTKPFSKQALIERVQGALRGGSGPRDEPTRRSAR